MKILVYSPNAVPSIPARVTDILTSDPLIGTFKISIHTSILL